MDIIEIYIWLGQTHSKGVLWYSVVELVMLFQSAEEMLVMAQGFVKAMAFHKEPIRLRMSPPSAAHVWAFMSARHGEPSCTQPPTPNREEEPQLFPSDPHPTSIASEPWGCQAMATHGGFPLGGCSQGTKCTPRDPPPTP